MEEPESVRANLAQEKKSVKETASGIGRSILDYIDKGVAASKKGFKAAGEALSDFGDKSVLRVELGQLKGKKSKAIVRLGELAYSRLAENSEAALKAGDADVAELIAELVKLDANIQKHEKELAAEQEKKAPVKEKNSAGEETSVKEETPCAAAENESVQ